MTQAISRRAFSTILSALLSHWVRHPFQLFTLMIGLATATALWSGVQAINAEARSSYERAAQTLAGPQRDLLGRSDGAAIGQETYLRLRQAGHMVSPLLEGRIETEAGDLRIVGIDPVTLPSNDLPGTRSADSPLTAGYEFFATPGQLLVSPATAERIGGSVGLPPLVEVNDIAPGIAYADIGIAQDLLDQPRSIGQLVITGPSSIGAPPISEIAPELERITPANESNIGRLTDSFHLNLTAFGLLSFAVGLFIVRGAIGLAFEQRRSVFRTLRALGVTRGILLLLLTAELLILAAIAGLIGVVLGWLMATLLIPDVAATLRGLYGAPVEGTLTLSPSWWLSGLAIAVAGTGLASAGSLWRIAHLPLLAPAQPRAWALAGRRAIRRQASIGAILLAVGLAVQSLDGLIAGFVTLGAFLVAAALILPVYLDIALSAAARLADGPRADWFWSDTRQQLPGLSLALMALLLALAANIGVGTMVNSFRLTFTGWLDQRLAAELYVSAETGTQSELLETILADRADAILPIRDAGASLSGAPGQVVGIADHATYRNNWPLIAQSPNIWDRIAEGDAALVNEQLARRGDLWPGSQITLAGHTLPIAGVYSDYGNTRGQAMIGLDLFDRLYPDASRGNYGIRTEDPDGLRRLIEQAAGVPPDRITDQAEIKKFSLQVFDRTFTVTAALNILTLSVAALAILTSLLTLAASRMPQLAPVWALGLTRSHLAGLELGRAIFLALLTFAAAIPVGITLAWFLLTVINVEAFGWRLPLHLFPMDWASLLGLSLLAAAAAALLPAWRLRRMPPSDLLKVFAHER